MWPARTTPVTYKASPIRVFLAASASFVFGRILIYWNVKLQCLTDANARNSVHRTHSRKASSNPLP